MVSINDNPTPSGADEALIAALADPAEASMVDALLALARMEGGAGERALDSALQAALARRMRAVIGRGKEHRRAA